MSQTTSSKQKQPRVKSVPVMSKVKGKKLALDMELVESDEEEVVKSLKLKPFFTEKGFKYGSGPNWGLTAAFKNQIDALNWKCFAEQRTGYVSGIVREFYDLVAAPNQTFLIMRGGKVTFDAARINHLYGLENGEDEYSDAIANLTKAQLNQIKKDLATEGTPWIETPEGKLKILRNQLKNEPKVWYHFIRHTLLPTAHNETVNQDRLVLLHCIMLKKKINVGNLLREQLIRCAMNKTTSLLFPCMITQLCLDQGIEAADEEGFNENKGPIDLQCIKRMSAGAEKPATEKKPDAGESGKQKSEENPSDKEFVQKLTILLLQHMTEQQEMWTFLHKKHTWDLENFKANSWSYATPIPKFPTHILRSLQEKKEETPSRKDPAPKAKQPNPAPSEDSTSSPPAMEKVPPVQSPTAKKLKRKAVSTPSTSPTVQPTSLTKKKSKLVELADAVNLVEKTATSKEKDEGWLGTSPSQQKKILTPSGAAKSAKRKAGAHSVPSKATSSEPLKVGYEEESVAKPKKKKAAAAQEEEKAEEGEEQEEEEEEMAEEEPEEGEDKEEEEVQIISATKKKISGTVSPPTRKSLRKK